MWVDHKEQNQDRVESADQVTKPFELILESLQRSITNMSDALNATLDVIETRQIHLKRCQEHNLQS